MENITYSSRKHLGRKQVILDCKFNIENGKEVEKIIAVESCPIILNQNCVQGHINFNGKLDTTLIYETVTGEKITLISVSDFSEIFDNNDIVDGSTSIINCKLVDITTPSIKSNEVKVACIIDVDLNLIYSNTIETQTTEDDVITKNCLTTITNHLCNICDTYNMEEEIKINDTLNKIVKIDAIPCLTNYYCCNGFVVVETNCLLTIIYENDENELKEFKTNVINKEEIECEFVTSENFLQLKITPMFYLEKTIVTQADNYNLIKLELPIQVNGNIFKTEDITIAEDAYSTKNIIKCNFKEINTINETLNYNFEESFNGSVTINKQDEINLIGSVNTNAECTNHTLNNNTITLEGIISTNILYNAITTTENDEQLKMLQSIIAEIGFTTQISSPKFENCSNLQVQCSVKNIEINYSNGEFNIVAQLCFCIFGTHEKNVKIIENFENINEREKKDYAIEMFLVEKNMELWNLAKEIGMKSEDILKQNPKLSHEIEKGSQIIVYHNIN